MKHTTSTADNQTHSTDASVHLGQNVSRSGREFAADGLRLPSLLSRGFRLLDSRLFQSAPLTSTEDEADLRALARKHFSSLGSARRGMLLAAALMSAGAAQASAEEPVALRASDVEVLITRALDLLQAGDYHGARLESERAMGQDPTQRATFLFGLACAREGNADSAVTAFKTVQRSPSADDFPQLPLELGLALLATGRLDEAKLWLEKAQTRIEDQATATQALAQLGVQQAASEKAFLVLKVGLLTGFDSNPSGLPDIGWTGCEPLQLGDESLPRSCGFLLGEDVQVGAIASRGNMLGSARYQFQHIWYLDRTLERFDQQDHHLHLALDSALQQGGGPGLAYDLEALSLANRYSPLYALEHYLDLHYRRTLRMPWNGASSASRSDTEERAKKPQVTADVGYQLGILSFADLTNTWQSESTSCITEGGESSIFCTSEQSGLRHRLRLGALYSQARLKLRLETLLERYNARAEVHDGLGWLTQLQAQAGQPRTVSLKAQVGYRHQWFPEWQVDQLQLSATVQRILWAGFHLQLRYGLDGLEVRLPDPSVAPRWQRRQQVSVEVSYEY